MLNLFKKLFLVTIGQFIPSDVFAPRHPVSTKGILIHDNKVLLLKNEHEEWDLPGGKLNKNETLENCLKREIKEETDLDIHVNKLFGAFVNNVIEKIEVVVLFYSCSSLNDLSKINISSEHFDWGFFSKIELNSLSINQKNKDIIIKVFEDN